MTRTAILIFCLSFFACKAAADLRPAIKGVICDAETHQPLGGVMVVSYDMMNLLTTTGGDGSFEIAAVKDRRTLPGEERGRLAPHSDMLVVKKNGYGSDTLNIFGPKAQREPNAIVMDTVFLQKQLTR
ncbi:peptidase associated/transthyretin-like domain-containing protein [Taibaiella soli]|uniref:Carboxypeptidase regulatory-like domain-containing protein n=1 Tax=Taibaiella soli TaxID=1649169 RepID=A0A2W2BCI6_9BACT|nr:hypothetical protein [Taibaiella soli]PZF73587.1 hypothetical protein DN068_07645 [Taibaiella soli]